MTNILRLDDHPALAEACDSGAPVVPLYIFDEAAMGRWVPGGARRWWLQGALKSLTADLAAMGSKLIVARGDTVAVLQKAMQQTGAGAIYLTRGYSPYERETEQAVHAYAVENDLLCRRFAGNLLLEPEMVENKQGRPYEVFTPFWRRACELIDDVAPLDAPEDMAAPDSWPESLPLDALEFAPMPAFWADPIAEVWQPGEAAARERLSDFLEEAAATYPKMRDYPAVEATSRLSPYLVSGEISPRRIWYETQRYIAANEASASGASGFLREVGWREFSYHLLFHFPHMMRAPLKERFADFPWRAGDGKALNEWQKGLTGFPIVDAGMRQLWQTGWMHNRVRMVVASFLVKDMLWHWHEGEDWFWDTLVDADPANNSASWQWVAGCGADAAPYFRIFNPIAQGEKFDKDGGYIRTYVPELADMPNDYIHKPFEAPEGVLRMAGVELGKTYPRPMLDRKAARERALAALGTIKK
ncbi:MAG: deoxyribodipyrimidine photo-lyase [Alphaproteobacteria bacterium]|nr:deoxyribodipyrimidine photo-lyase [Alphaproteobacteria bacterium]